MPVFGEKKRKSWQKITFGHQQTRTGALAREQARSRVVTRVTILFAFALGVTICVGLGPVLPTEWVKWLTLLSLVLLVHGVMFLLVRTYHREVFESVRRFTQFFLLVGLYFAIAKATVAAGFSPYLIPLPLLAIPLALIYSGPLAIHSCLAVTIVTAFLVFESRADVAGSYLTNSIGLAAAVSASILLGAIVAILGAARIRTRTKVVTVGAASGLMQVVAICVCNLQLGPPEINTISLGEFFVDPALGFVNGLVCGMIITSILPFVERIFEVTTDMRLLELADQNRPLLRQFALLAPGSFQHSLMVGQLAEEAAKSISANDLLARVGAYYHDIGKMMKPNYFVENMRNGDNVHDRLSPEMSRLIIVSHVKDGIRIAQEERLPKPVIDMIPMHHGTSVVEYFYNKKRMQEEEAGMSESSQESFQYPGPRPTFREAGILMLADTTEAISRVLGEPTPARLRTVVRNVIQKKMETQQLDECELTMHDLSRIEDAFVRVLSAIHHGRVRYPAEEDLAKKKMATATRADAAARDPSGSHSRPKSTPEASDGDSEQQPEEVPQEVE